MLKIRLCAIFAFLLIHCLSAQGEDKLRPLQGQWTPTTGPNIGLRFWFVKGFIGYDAVIPWWGQTSIVESGGDFGSHIKISGSKDGLNAECFYYISLLDSRRMAWNLRHSTTGNCPESLIFERVSDEVTPEPAPPPTSPTAPNKPPTGDDRPRIAINSFAQRHNQDIYGHDIPLSDGRVYISGVDINGCAAECGKMAACVAFSFDRWNDKCFLKDEVSNSIVDVRSTIAVKKPRQLPKVSTQQTEIQPVHRRQFLGNIISGKQASDFSKCKSNCYEDENCIAFTFFKGTVNNKCQEFKEVNGYTLNNNADGGHKYQKP